MNQINLIKKLNKYIFLLIGVFCFSNLAFGAQVNSSCLTCHKGLDDEVLSEPANFGPNDVHANAGLTCADCHGGDATSSDPSVAMDVAKGFIGKPQHTDIPKLCAKCHSDSEFMKQHNPSLPVDQMAKYEVSDHGKLSAQGDQKAAVCSSCHGAHNILSASDRLSPVNTLNIVDTCAKCHSDAAYMESYGIPTNQASEYKDSVHGQAFFVKGDASSPTCVRCHGSHNAGLPKEVFGGNVCGQCHVLNYDLFGKSPHKAAYEKEGLSECQDCHGSHGIKKPSDEMIGGGDDSVCLQCHEKSSLGFGVAVSIKNSIDGLKVEISAAKKLVEKAKSLGVDQEDALSNIEEASSVLTKSRTYIHTFSKDEVGVVVAEGSVLAGKAKEGAQEAINKLDSRKKWHAFVVVLILVFAASLYSRIKILEKR